MTRFEPPYTEPYVRWCGRNGSARTRSYPIMALGPLSSRHPRRHKNQQPRNLEIEHFCKRLNSQLTTYF